MAYSREIVTIQAGNYANFVGTHWWNIQESSFCYDQNSALPLDINHDVLFREGLNYKGEVTYTPRLVLIDLKENVRSIRSECPLYRYPDKENDLLWEGQVEVIKEPPGIKNPFLESTSNALNKDKDSTEDAANSLPDSHFDSQDTSWSDVLRTNLHPASFCLLQEITPENRSPLDIYSSGDEVYKKSGKEVIEESIRKMSEDCDYLQGFQLIYDSCDGFSSVSNNILQYLDDEFNRRSSLCFPTYQSCYINVHQDVKQQMHRLYAILSSLNSMCSYSSLFSPLSLSNDIVKFDQPYQSFPYLQYNESFHYHTSSILAAALEALTSQFRLKSFKFSLSDVTSAMSMYSRKLICSSVCLPFPLPEDAFLNMLVQRDTPDLYMRSVSPFYNPETERTLFQSAVLRGVPKSKLLKANKSVYSSPDPEEIFGEYLKKYSASSVSTATVLYEKFSVKPPFPNLFKSIVGKEGFLNQDLSSNNEAVESVPIAASFSNSDSAAVLLDSLLHEGSKNSFKDYIKNTESTFEKDDFCEVMQTVIGLRDNYQDY